MRTRDIGMSALVALGLMVTTANAEVVRSEVTETTVAGTATTITPSSQIVVATAGRPTTYTITDKTTFVDAAGNVITYEQVRDRPVKVYFAPGQPQVVSRVVVTEPAKQVIEERTVEHPHIEHRIERQIPPTTQTETRTETTTVK